MNNENREQMRDVMYSIMKELYGCKLLYVRYEDKNGKIRIMREDGQNES